MPNYAGYATPKTAVCYPQNCGTMPTRFAGNKNPMELWGMKEGLTNDQKKEWAQLLYTEHSTSIKEIALKLNEPEAEIRKWIQEGKWEGLKKSIILTKDAQLYLLYELLQFASARIKKEGSDDMKDIDRVLKLTAAIKNLETETGVAQAIDMAKDFINWLKEDEPEAVLSTTQRLNRYIKFKERKH